MERNLRIDVHIIQNFGPACLNADELKQAKTAYLGRYLRGRISSQCLKAAMRKMMRLLLPSKITSISTRCAPEILSKTLIDLGCEPDLVALIVPLALTAIDVGLNPETGRTETQMSLARESLQLGAAKIIELWPLFSEMASALDAKLKKPLKKPLKKSEVKAHLSAIYKSVLGDNKKDLAKQLGVILDPAAAFEIAMFGRFIASAPENNIERAFCMANALSTHEVQPEQDYFAAIDEFDPKGGASMLAIQSYNASCYYMNGFVDIPALSHNMYERRNFKEDLNAISMVLDAFIRVISSIQLQTKQTVFAAYTRPAYVSVILREISDKPVDFSEAFVKPITVDPKNPENIVLKSINALKEFRGSQNRVYGEEGIVMEREINIYDPSTISLETLISDILAAVKQEV